MDTLRANYRDDDGDDTNEDSTLPPPATPAVDGETTGLAPVTSALISHTNPKLPEKNLMKGITEETEAVTLEDDSSDELDLTPQDLLAGHSEKHDTPNSPKFAPEIDGGEDGEEEDEPPSKKQKQLPDQPKPSEREITELPLPDDKIAPLPPNGKPPTANTGKKPRKKNKDVWATTSRRGRRKTTKHASNGNYRAKNATYGPASIEDRMLLSPIARFPDRSDDNPDLKICLSKINKAEKVELSVDRLTASSIKGYRMVRATRGVTEGAWYFEIKVLHLGETGHARLGWSTEKGDLQAPVGYDGNSFGYRDIDGTKVHKASREKYGDEGYKEGDVIGFYINMPNGESYAPTPRTMVWHNGQRYAAAAADTKDDSPKIVPGSEILYFKNGICQGVAFTDICGGRYYPAASMYTLPNEPPCVVKFNFGPDFERFPEDFGEHTLPRPMIEVPYQSYDGRVETGRQWNITRMCPVFKVIKEETVKL